MTRTQVGASLVGFCLAAVACPRGAQANCCEPQQVTVYVHGRYSNANPGDAVVNYLSATTPIAPIIEAIGENYSHSMLVFRATGEVFHNVGDPNSIIKAWDCSHPLDPYQLRPMAPGAQAAVFADTNYNSFQAGEVLHGASVASANDIFTGNNCIVWPLGAYASPAIGYDLYGFSHNVPNGMCVEMLTTSCHVPRPAPKAYSAATVANAVSAMYNAIYGQAANMSSWLESVYCPGWPRYAANQVVNTFLYGNPWDTNTENWSVPVTAVVTPAQLVATFTGKKEPVGLVAGYYTTQEQMVCHPGQCY
jgi:hypothetical protein